MEKPVLYLIICTIPEKHLFASLLNYSGLWQKHWDENKQEKARGCLAFPSQDTADGNADRIRVSRASAVADRWGCKSVRIPAVGVVTARNYGYYREKHGVTIGVAPIKIEM